MNVLLPGQYTGICKEPYLVVQRGGTYPHGGRYTTYSLILVIGYVPADQPRALSKLLKQARATLAGQSYLRETGNETPETPNDKFKAHEAAIEYQVLQAI